MTSLSRIASALPVISLLFACGSSDSSRGHSGTGNGGTPAGGAVNASGSAPSGGNAAAGATGHAGNGGNRANGGAGNAGGNSGAGNSGGNVTGGSSASSGGNGGNEPDAGPIVAPEPLSANIVVDQFGYRTTAEKLAVIRSPPKGFDAGKAF